MKSAYDIAVEIFIKKVLDGDPRQPVVIADESILLGKMIHQQIEKDKEEERKKSGLPF